MLTAREKQEKHSISKWRETQNLLTENEDYDVSFTVAIDAPLPKKHNDKKDSVENEWKKYIHDLVIKPLNSKQKFHVKCSVARYNKVNDYTIDEIYSNAIINHFWKHVEYGDGVRITVTKENGQYFTWIIVRP